MSEQSSRGRNALLVGGVLVLVAGLTLLVYLARAGAGLDWNWPTSYNLTSSDNGVLYQLARDVFSGFTLDWSFSPQVYIFPEIPISLLAYALAAGSLAWYYVIVAVLNVLLLFAALWWLMRLLFDEPLIRQLARAFLATSPLIVLPLLAQQTMYVFQLAPTYYYGMYLFGLLLPVALLAKRRWLGVLVLAGWALTGAADPLLFAMTLPGIAVALFTLFVTRGWRGDVLRIGGSVAAALAAAFAVRLVFFNAIAGTDPSSYISVDRGISRLRGIKGTFNTGFHNGLDPWLLALTIVALAACGLLFVLTVRRFVAGSPENDRRMLARIYLTTLPFLGALAMYLILAVHVYYLWFGVVGSIVIAAALLPRPRVLLPLAAGIAALTLVISLVGVLRADYAAGGYFGYRAELTQCLDEAVPGQLGYSTFSDARSYGLTSATGVQLIAVNPDLSPNFWLTNRAYSKELVGTFIVLNPNTAEPPLEPAVVREAWGVPDRVTHCGDTLIWSYDSVGSAGTLATWFEQFQGLR